MADIVLTVIEADGTTETDVPIKDDGRESAAASRPVVLSNEDFDKLSALTVTEDAATAANPAGPLIMARRRDSMTSEVTTDGDVVALNATARGELRVDADLRSSSSSFGSVNSGTSSVTILAASATRKGATIVNTDANILYLDMTGGTAATTRYAYALAQGAILEVPFGYAGNITGIWAADGSGAALVTEFS